MRLQEYLRSKETVYCQTECMIYDHSKAVSLEDSGELAVTDTRVAFTKGSRVVDLDPSKIHKIEYTPKRIPWFYVLLIALAVFIVPVGFVADGIINAILGPLPPVMTVIMLLVGVFVLMIGIAGVVQRYKAKLVIHSSKAKYVFFGRDLEQFPHAIRGVS